MAQDRQSGLEASRFGHRCARAIAKAIGAEMIGNKSNECIWKGERVLIKTAHLQTTSVGVLNHMVDRIKAVIGAFEQNDGSYRVFQLPIKACTSGMRPTASKGASHGRVGIVARKVFKRAGTLIGTITINESSYSSASTEHNKSTNGPDTGKIQLHPSNLSARKERTSH